MPVAPRVRKLLLAAHLSTSIGWIGAAAAYLGLGIAAETSNDPETIRGAWVAMELIGWYVIVPLAVGALATGVSIALGTRWGLFQHYWVIFSLGLTTFATGVLVQHMPSVTSTASAARTAGPEQLQMLGGDIAHPAIGLVVLVATLALNIYKPRGITSYGERKRSARTGQVESSPAP